MPEEFKPSPADWALKKKDPATGKNEVIGWGRNKVSDFGEFISISMKDQTSPVHHAILAPVAKKAVEPEVKKVEAEKPFDLDDSIGF